MSEEDDVMIELFEPTVFAWLDVIHKGTNNSAMAKLLTAEGICYTFDLPDNIGKYFIKKWRDKKHYNE